MGETETSEHSNSSANSLKAEVLDIPHKISGTIFYLISAIVLILLILGIIGYSVNHHKNSNTPKQLSVASNVCTNSQNLTTFEQAVNAVSTNSTSQEQTVPQLKKIQNYQQDPNCTYLITVFYTNSLDYKNAEANLKLFQTYYHGQKLYPGFSVKQLNEGVANINKLLSQSKQNIIYIKSPTVKKS